MCKVRELHLAGILGLYGNMGQLVLLFGGKNLC
jgi:hypothetical protein